MYLYKRISPSRVRVPRSLLLAALLGLRVSALQTARADTFTVASGDVYGANGLVAALNAANDPIHHPGPNTIVLTKSAYTLTQRNNALYGWTGLPLISSDVTIEGNGAIIERGSDPNTPTFRLFVIAGPDDRDTNTNLPVTTGSLTLRNLWLRGGLAKGGNGGSGYGMDRGGGGMGAGGGIYNRGTLSLSACTLSTNTARGGDNGPESNGQDGGAGGGGMGGDGGSAYYGGGGGGGMGGNGGNAYVTSYLSDPDVRIFGAGGGGTFGNGSNGAIGIPGVGGPFNGGYGIGYLSTGSISGNGGYGGGGGGDMNGSYAGGWGGVGGGGGGTGTADSAGGGNGGFGGGGGGSFGDGGFGGGGGGGALVQEPYGNPPTYLPTYYTVEFGIDGGIAGFGGAQGGDWGGGGMGAGGAIFNDGGSVSLVNSTLTGNTAMGGSTAQIDYSTYEGAYMGYIAPLKTSAMGAGGGLFSRNGLVSINGATFSVNTAQGGRAGYFDTPTGPNGPGAGGALYLLADKSPVYIDGPQTIARHDLNPYSVYYLNNSIFANSANGIADVCVNSINGGSFFPGFSVNNLAQTVPAGKPTSGTLYFTDAYGGSAPIGVTQTADPLLGPLQYNGGLTPTMAPAYNSPVIDAANANLSPALDQRGIARPIGAGPDIGAVEFQPTLRIIITGITASRITAGTVNVTLVVQNSGNVPLANIKVTSARLRTLSPGAVPAPFDLAPGATRGMTLSFSASAPGIAAGTAPFVFNGSYTGGTFSSGSNIVVPPVY